MKSGVAPVDSKAAVPMQALETFTAEYGLHRSHEKSLLPAGSVAGPLWSLSDA